MSRIGTLHARIINTHDIEENWNKTIDFIPRAGELIVYDADDSFNYARFKLGDGITDVKSLPFMANVISNLTAEQLFATPADSDTIFLDAGNIRDYQ